MSIPHTLPGLPPGAHPGSLAGSPIAPTDGAAPAFGVYVHWPFCAQKCPYCDFNSHVRHGGWDEARFLRAYLAELDWTAARMAGNGQGATSAAAEHGVASIFFGGGTPSLMQPETVAAIIDHIGRLWPLAPDAEITLEANPGSVEAGRFRGYREAGVNRVSLGLQSLHDDELRRLGRIHTVAEAKAAVGIAQATFARSSFDLIYARPGQTVEAWRAELAEALAMAAGHLSLYQLTIEPDTPYAALAARGKLSIPPPEAALALWDATQELTTAAGLPAYEISNHARAGEMSRHNLVYWRYGAYAGVGPGAHGRLLLGPMGDTLGTSTRHGDGRGDRRGDVDGRGQRIATATEKNPESWAGLVERQGHGVVEEAALQPAEAADELLLMGLRLAEGIDLGRLARIGGVRPSDKVIAELVDLGVLARAGPDRIAATGEGRFILNELVLRLSTGFVPIV